MNKFDFNKLGNHISGRNLVIFAVLVAVLVFGLSVRRFVLNRKSNSSQVAGAAVESQGAQLIEINRLFEFPLTDNQGEEISKIKYELLTAELTDTILYQGEPAGALPGHKFLVLSIKITNDFEQNIEINSGDYIRIKLANRGDELLAADMHNDPVKVQAISTKYTKLGFSIPKDSGEISMLIGEITGEKQEFAINFN